MIRAIIGVGIGMAIESIVLAGAVRAEPGDAAAL